MSELENNLIEKVKILILYGDRPVDGKDKEGKVERIFKEDDDTAHYFYIREFLQSLLIPVGSAMQRRKNYKKL